MWLSTHLTVLAAYGFLALCTLSSAADPQPTEIVIDPFSVEEDSCCFYTTADLGCYMLKGPNWRACWSAGPYMWLQDDTDKAKCLTDLHVVQPGDRCISNEGSMCESYGSGSKLLNAQVDASAISDEASLAIKGALDHMLKIKMGLWFGPRAGPEPGPGLYVGYTGDGTAEAIHYRFGGGMSNARSEEGRALTTNVPAVTS